MSGPFLIEPVALLEYLSLHTQTQEEMTEAFTAGVMIFIEQFRARWQWSIDVLES